LLVAGGIFGHNIPFFHHFMEDVPVIIKDFLLGLLVGSACLPIINFVKKLIKKMIKKK
jgi:hypothetical protein